MNYTEEDLLAFIERHDEHEEFYKEHLRKLRAGEFPYGPEEDEK